MIRCNRCLEFYMTSQSTFCPHEHFPTVRRHSKPRHEKRRAVLKDWNIIRRYADGRGLSHVLEGVVYGHDSFGEGSFITTSPLLRLDIPAREAETLNTVYLLG